MNAKITSIVEALACTFVAAPEDRVLIIRVRDANDMMKNNRDAKSGQRELNEGKLKWNH